MISIIVPVYNVEKYLRRCIDSILSQTYRDIEVILVDDGSTDSSPAICDEYGEKDSRITVIHKPNGGLSDARNSGINIAKGEYLGFVDSDDYISSEMYEKLLSNAEKHKADIAVCNAELVQEGKSAEFKENDGVRVYDGNATYAMICQRAFTVNAWNKLYRRELFDTVRYPVGMLYEDLATTYKLTELSQKVVVLEQELYAYVQRAGSIMNETRFMIKKDKVLIVAEMWDYICNNNYTQLADLQMGVAEYFLADTFNMLGCGNWVKNSEYRSELNKFLSGKRSKLLSNPRLSLYRKTVMVFATLFPNLTQMLFNIRRKDK